MSNFHSALNMDVRNSIITNTICFYVPQQRHGTNKNNALLTLSYKACRVSRSTMVLSRFRMA